MLPGIYHGVQGGRRVSEGLIDGSSRRGGAVVTA